MKQIFTPVLLLAVCPLFAQVTLTEINTNPTIGATFTYHTTNLVTPGPSGTGATWDFSAGSDDATLTHTYVAPASTPNPTDFNPANICLELQSTYDYYLSSSSAWTRQGIAASGLVIPYDDGEDIYRFPMSFGDTFSDTFSGSYNVGGFPGTRSGTVTVTADGEGTLITPSGTFTDVLRIRISDVATDSVTIGPIVQAVTSTTESYHYRKAGILSPLYIISIVTAGPSPTTEAASYMEVAAGVGIEEEAAAMISLYPNPVADVLNVTLPQTEPVVVTIIDMNGKLVYSAPASGLTAVSVPVAGFAAGLYSVNVRDVKGNSYTASFVK